MYEEIAPLVRSCLDGFNTCIFAYGQTGSGNPFSVTWLRYNSPSSTRAWWGWARGRMHARLESPFSHVACSDEGVRRPAFNWASEILTPVSM